MAKITGLLHISCLLFNILHCTSKLTDQIKLNHDNLVILGPDITVVAEQSAMVDKLSLAQSFDEQLVAGDPDVVEEVAVLYSERGYKDLQATELNRDFKISTTDSKLKVLCPLEKLELAAVRYKHGNQWHGMDANHLSVPIDHDVQTVLSAKYSGSPMCQHKWIQVENEEIFLSNTQSADYNTAAGVCQNLDARLTEIKDESKFQVLKWFSQGDKDHYSAWVADIDNNIIEDDTFKSPLSADKNQKLNYVCSRQADMQEFRYQEENEPSTLTNKPELFNVQLDSTGSHVVNAESTLYKQLGVDVKATLQLEAVVPLSPPLDIIMDGTDYLINQPIDMQAHHDKTNQQQLQYDWLVFDSEGNEIDHNTEPDGESSNSISEPGVYNVTLTVSNDINSISTWKMVSLHCGISGIGFVIVRTKKKTSDGWTYLPLDNATVDRLHDIQAVIMLHYYNSEVCQGAWIQINGKEYLLSDREATLTQAQQQCNEMKSSLADVTQEVKEIFEHQGQGAEAWIASFDQTQSDKLYTETSDPTEQKWYLCERPSDYIPLQLSEKDNQIITKEVRGITDLEFSEVGDHTLVVEAPFAESLGLVIKSFQEITVTELSGMKATMVFPYNGDRNHMISPQFGDHNLTLARQFVFVQISFETSDANKFTVEINEGNIMEFSSKAFEVPLDLEPKQYNLLITEMDSGAHLTVELNFRSLPSTSDFGIKESYLSTTDDQTTFSILTSYYGYSAENCLIMNYGDGDVESYWGSLGLCQIDSVFNVVLNSSPLPDTEMPEYEEPSIFELFTFPIFRVQHFYANEGNYTVTAVLRNFVSEGEATTTVEIHDLLCPRPQIDIFGSSLNPHQPSKLYRSDQIRVESRVQINCSYTGTNFKRWDVVKLPLETGKGEEIKISDEKRFDRTTLMLAPRFLELGHYRVCLYVELDRKAFPANEATVWGQKCAFIDVIAADIMPGIYPGQEETMTVGTDQPIEFDSWKNSFDPNLNPTDDKKFTKFTWYCREENEQQFQEIPAEGSCFTTDPSHLHWFTGKVVMARAGDYFAPGKYYIKVEVERDYEVVEFEPTLLEAQLTVQLHVVNYTIPDVEFSCIRSCPTTAFGTVKLSPGYSNDVVVKCTGCQPGQLSGVTTTVIMNDGSVIELSQDSVKRATENSAVVELEALVKEFPNAQQIIVNTEIAAHDTTDVVTFRAKINTAPEDGLCSAEPNTGVKALETDVQLRCWDWQDEDGVQKYEFYRLIDGERVLHQTATSSGVAFVKLPPGKHVFEVDISDRLDMTHANVPVGTVIVEEQSLANTNLTDMVQELRDNGNPAETLSTIQSIIESLEKSGTSGSYDADGSAASQQVETGLKGFSSNLQLQEVTGAIEQFIESDAVPEHLEAPLRDLLETAKDDPSQIEKLTDMLVSGEFANVSGISTSELKKMVEGMVNSGNDAMALLLNDMVTAVSEVPIESGADIIPVIDTVNSILNYGSSTTLNLVGTEESSSVFEIVVGRMLTEEMDLTIVEGIMSMDGSDATIDGVFRPASPLPGSKKIGVSSLESERSVTHIINDGLGGTMKVNTGMWFLKNKMTISLQESTLEYSPTAITFYPVPQFTHRDVDYTGLGIQIWNATTDVIKGGDLNLVDGTISTFSPFTDAHIKIEVPEAENGTKVLNAAGHLPVKEATVRLSDGSIVELGAGTIYSRKDRHKDDRISLTLEGCPITSQSGKFANLAFEPLRFERITNEFMQELQSPGIKQISLRADGIARVMLASPEAKPMQEYGAQKMEAAGEFFPLYTGFSKMQLEDLLLSGEMIDLGRAEVTTSDGSIYTMGNDTSISMDGQQLNVYNYGSEDGKFPSPYISAADITFAEHMNDENKTIIYIKLIHGTVITNTKDHVKTTLLVKNGGSIKHELGRIYRPKQSRFVITKTHTHYIGMERPDGQTSGTIPQALVNHESQSMIKDIMKDATDVLEQSADTMTLEEIETASSGLLEMAAALSTALKQSMDSPLPSDMKIALDYEKENYDDLFLPLPLDRSKIRYVEEYTEEEWAREAVKLKQQDIAKSIVAQIESTMETIQNTLIERITAGKNKCGNSGLEVDGGELYVSLCDAETVLSENPKCTDWEVRFPATLADIGLSLPPSTLIVTKLLCLDSNPYAFAENAELLINSGSLTVTLEDVNGNNLNVTNAVKNIELRGAIKNAAPEPPLSVGIPTLKTEEVIKLHMARVQQYNISLFIEIERTNKDPGTLVAFLSYNKIPSPYKTQHEFSVQIKPSAVKFHWPLDLESLVNHSGIFYLGIGQLASNVSESDIDYDSYSFTRKFTVSYTARVISKGCYYFDSDRLLFDSYNVEPGNLVGDTRISCYTKHLSPFSAGLFIPLNKIDFDFLFTNFHYENNPTLLTALIVIAVSFLFLFILCNVLDRTDINKGRVFPLCDNRQQDKYLYLLIVETGYRMYSTCDSNVYFVLSGSHGETEARSLKIPWTDDDEVVPILRWGTKDRFLVSTKQPLGELNSIRLWHDHSGHENKASWYLARAVVKDLQTEETYTFHVNNWLAFDHGDGQTERYAAAASLPELKTWSRTLAVHDLVDHYIYFSIFTGGGCRARRFWTRCARLSSLLCLTLTTMLITAVFLSGGTDLGGDIVSQEVGPFIVGTTDMFYGIIVCLLANPVLMIFGQLFRCSTTHQKSRNVSHLPEEFTRNTPRDSCSTFIIGPYALVIRMLAWLMVAGTVVVCVFALLLFGIQFQEQESRHWMVSFIFNMFVSIFLFEPIKAVFIVLYSRKTGVQKKNLVEPEELDEILYTIDKREGWKLDHDYKSLHPPELILIDNADTTKMRDEQLYEVIRELLTYFVFLILITTLCYGSRVPIALNYHHSIRHTFGIDEQYVHIRTPNDFWNWTRQYLAPGLRVAWYDKKPAWGMRGYLNDKASRIMGFGLVRQVRNRPNDHCKVHPLVEHLFTHCNTFTSGKREDDTPAYTVGWEKPLEMDQRDQTPVEYHYKDATELKGMWHLGVIDSYSGGGYAMLLNGTVNSQIAKFNELQNQGWIDDKTRAVFIEMSAYQPHTNLFAIIQLVLEIPPVGAMIPRVWIEPLRLLKYEANNALQILAAELAFCIVAIVYAFKETRNMHRLGPKEYFCQFWCWVDFLITTLSLVSIGCYIARFVMVSSVLALFKETNGNVFIKLDYERILDLVFLWIISFILFLATFKLLRILRFNKRISMLSATLSRASPNLLNFLIIFLIVLNAYDMALYMVLSRKLENYSTYIRLVETTFSAMLGKFDMNDIFMASWLAPIIFMFFMASIAILMLNLFITLLICVYEEVRTESGKQANDYELMTHLKFKILQSTKMVRPSDWPSKDMPNQKKMIGNVWNDVNSRLDMFNGRMARNFMHIDVKPAKETKKKKKFIISN